MQDYPLLFPFYWMVTTSLKTQIVALASPPQWVFEPTLGNYTEVLFKDKVGGSLINSLIVAVCLGAKQGGGGGAATTAVVVVQAAVALGCY